MVGVGPLAGVRVLDRTSGIAGPYCTKLLADAGADVVKVEARDDPMRSWRSGALFEYLHAGKRSVADDADARRGRGPAGRRRIRPMSERPGSS